MNNSPEPPIGTRHLRRFTDPTCVEVESKLGEQRRPFDSFDDQILPLAAQRALCVGDATRFKPDGFLVAAAHEASFPGLSDSVDATYRTLVAGSVAGEGHICNDTKLIDP